MGDVLDFDKEKIMKTKKKKEYLQETKHVSLSSRE